MAGRDGSAGFWASGKMEYVFAGALGVIILGALALTLYFAFFGNEQNRTLGDGLAHLECLNPACKNQFTMPQQDVAPLEMPGQRILCPKCQKKSAVSQSMCPSCKKWYLDPRAVYDMSPSGPPEGLKAVCPYCKTDMDEFYRAEAMKRRGAK